MQPAGDPFQEPIQQPLIIDVDGFEGPLDLLLTLARTQKLDLTAISITDLADQYIGYVEEVRSLKLEIAADYLVMAAWLAYLKSRLLLPKEANAEEPSAEELALRLQWRLQRLEAMREAGARLMACDRLGRDIFARGTPEGIQTDKRALYDVTLYELLKAYGGITAKEKPVPLQVRKRPVYSLEEALERLSALIGTALSWTDLSVFLPEAAPELSRSARASLFAASLEMARQGRVDLQQREVLGPLYLRAVKREETP